jgi:hypothetical protein
LQFLTRTNTNSNDPDESLKTIPDNRMNCLREHFKDDLHRTKLSIQINCILELERLRVIIQDFQFSSNNSFFSFFHIE